MMTPQEQVAAQFMATRGYRIPALAVERLEHPYSWRFDYELDEGRLELDVTWTEEDGWRAQVWDFERRA